MLQQQGGQDVDFDDAGRAEAVPAIIDGADSGGAIDDAHGEAARAPLQERREGSGEFPIRDPGSEGPAAGRG